MQISGRKVRGSLCGALLTLMVVSTGVASQEAPIHHDSGQSVAPFFEGWLEKDDGTILLSFGYLNFNFQEEVDIPIGPDNKIEPGAPDQGQPSHFLTRRQVGVFTVVLPKTAPRKGVKWTLNFRGRTLSVPATLDPLYVLDTKAVARRTFMGNGLPEDNTPPIIKFDPASRGGMGIEGTRTTVKATLPAPVALTVWASDDGLPRRGPKGDQPSTVTLSWSKFRGVGKVTFSDPAPPIDAASTKATTTASFSEPGTYVLRVLAVDGSGFSDQCCWTNGYVTVNVARSSTGGSR